MREIRLLVTLSLMVLANCVATAHSQALTDPPDSLPHYCELFTITSLASHAGSDSYLMLRYEVAAMSAGHDAEKRLNMALHSMKSITANPTSILTDIFLDFQIAQDEYSCGAFIIGQYKPVSDDQKVTRQIAISVYNRLAIVSGQTGDYIAQRLKAASSADLATDVSNAQRLADLTSQRDQAFSDLTSAMTFSAILSVYLGDPTAKKTDTLNMSSAERLALISETKNILKDNSSDRFTAIAGLLLDFLAQHTKSRI